MTAAELEALQAKQEQARRDEARAEGELAAALRELAALGLADVAAAEAEFEKLERRAAVAERACRISLAEYIEKFSQ